MWFRRLLDEAHEKDVRDEIVIRLPSGRFVRATLIIEKTEVENVIAFRRRD
jgi:hypothetical protein